jgi:hypothetical protein
VRTLLGVIHHVIKYLSSDILEIEFILFAHNFIMTFITDMALCASSASSGEPAGGAFCVGHQSKHASYLFNSQFTINSLVGFSK